MARGWRMVGAMLAGVTAAQAAENPLARDRWSSRVLVISAPEPGDPRVVAQRAELDRARAGATERDLVIREAFGDTAEARRLRAALGLPADGFRVVLVGKDGEAKRTGTAPIPADALFETIDAMPMRRGERGR
ncbi:hypothetical protein ASF49_19975 [Methylobacterium sp. Leaf104]|uniref:DUF4174 domain-containing protein n=1 Tax=Methylobacterium TaxID=407 RepID=UPI0006FA8AAD|nr:MULTISPECIES: DUF4174 domain-containing protein [Methylobacterium]KQP40955.1 hypothetical protein ASF49_19975 [Methylobacterium sp. Leaf104]MCI9880829.1 DUF4174 domain-containing protein [Methylobacterium goesingense]